jgi:transmembrane sensor
MDKDQLKHIMQKYLDGTATAREKKMIEAWILLSEKEEARIPERGKEAIKNRIWMQIRPEVLAAQKTNNTLTGEHAGKTVSLPQSHKPFFLRLSARGLRYAALWMVLICIIAEVWVYRESILDRIYPIAEQSRQAGPYETIQLLLPDSSLVTLAANSSICYPVRYRGGNRWARLNGKAFFNVRQDPSASFTLRSRGMDVKVLGTSFEVNNMDKGNMGYVTVVTGKVQVTDDNQPVVLLTQNQRVSFDRSDGKALIERDIDATALTSWTLNRMAFNETSLAIVLQAISAGYGIKIESEKKALKPGATFSGHFSQSESWKDLLDVVCISSGLSWSVKGDHVVVARH